MRAKFSSGFPGDSVELIPETVREAADCVVISQRVECGRVVLDLHSFGDVPMRLHVFLKEKEKT